MCRRQQKYVLWHQVEGPKMSLGVIKSMECNSFSFSALTLFMGDRKAIRPVEKTGCWLVGGDDLTGTLHVL